MWKISMVVISLAVCLALTGLTAAQEWDIEIPSTSAPPIIDGEIDPVWSIASVQYMTNALSGSYSATGCAGRWQVMWDAQYLYAIVDVNDQSLKNDSADHYQDDSVEFYFDGHNSKGPGTPLSDDDRQYTFGWTTDVIAGTNQDDTGVEHAQVDTATGWRIEMKFPWTTLSTTPHVMGDLIGIDCFYNDDDAGGDRESQISTFADDGGDWQNPADWGTGILVKGSAEKASSPVPADRATDVLRDIMLEWDPGQFAATHDVYFGTVFDDVNNASRNNPLGVLAAEGQAASTYELPEILDFGQTYYWRIDEVNGAPDFTIFKGDVWSFTAEPFAYPIEGILATSNVISAEGQGPENTVNGSGLNANDQHSTDTSDMWGGTAPAGEPPYIQWEFDRVYKLHEMYVWNHNFTFEIFLGVGLRNVTVEHSLDGVTWSVLGDFELARATGTTSYTYNTTIAFDNVAAKYVRLMIESPWGSSGQMGLSEVRITYIPAHAREPEPADGAADVPVNSILSWRPGRDATSHEVYLGTDPEALDKRGATAQSSFNPGDLDLGTTYYWRIDAVNPADAIGVWEGDLWSFSTEAYTVVEDFEAYTDDFDAGEAIWQTWIDGWDDNANGSQVGYAVSPFAEQTIIHGGKQAMPLFYNNPGAGKSQAVRTFAPAQNWTAGGVRSFSLWFQGAVGNSGQLYVIFNGTKVPYDGDPADIARPQWQPWNIDLTTLGANLNSVTTLTIGIEGAGSGVVYIDDIRLYAREIEKIVPVEPGAADLAARYAMDDGSGTTVADASGNGNHGTIVGNPTWVTGVLGGALNFSGDDYVDCGNDASLQIRDTITVACWIKVASFTVSWETIVAMGDDSYRIGRGPETGNGMHFGCNGTSAGNFNAPSIISTDTWRHVAGVYDGANMYIYVDGVEDARIESTGQINVSSYNLFIAENAQATGRQLDGLIDDVRIYSRPLSAEEMAGLAGRTTPIHVPF